MNFEAPLTKSELEVVAMLAMGWSKKEIAYERGSSVRTVEHITRSAYRKIEIQKVNEATKWWFMKAFAITEEQIRQATRMLLIIVMIIAGHEMKALAARPMGRANNRRPAPIYTAGRRRNDFN
jgi:DNA-binding CsgD family transcriptional regulator